MNVELRKSRLLLYLVIAALALLARWPMLPLSTRDLRLHVIPWLVHAEATGGGYLVQRFTDYAPFYDHSLALLALLPGPEIYRLKLFSIAFELLLAWSVTLVVDREARIAAFGIVLFLPTVLTNSARLGQTDALYAWLLIASIAASLRARPVVAMLAFSLAIAVKLQALMFAPVLVLLWLERRQPLWTFALAPIGYLLLALPMLLAGRPAASVFGVYDAQFHYFRYLSAMAPNPWLFATGVVPYRWGIAVGLPLAMLITIGAVWWLWRTGIARSREGLLLAAAILLVSIPFVTPKMHDRYFYTASPLLVALALTRRRYVSPLILAETASFISYPVIRMILGWDSPIFGKAGFLQRHVHQGYMLLPATGAVLMGAALILLIHAAAALRRELDPNSTPKRYAFQR